jgi:hypothetical protein
MGVPVASSETFTWLHQAVFRATPLDIKAEASLHFLQGITQITCHGWPSTAPGVSYPGWSFYAAAVFNDKNPWFIAMPDVAKYLQRASSLLRQGKPANDVAVYLADSDAWANFTPMDISVTGLTSRYIGSSVGTIIDAGYNLDFFDDGMLDRLGKVDGPALAFGDLKYKAVVLVGVKRIPLSTMRQLETFARNGGIVVAMNSVPSIAPGYLASDTDTQEVAAISQRLFNDPNAPGIFVKTPEEFAPAMNKRLTPDAAFAPGSPDLGVVHRHTDGGEVYFVANTGNTPKNVTAAFRVDGMNAEQWDPMTGTERPIAVTDRSGGTETVALSLPAYGTTFIVFTSRTLPAAPASTVAAAPAALDLSSGWNVTFSDQYGDVPAAETMDKLHSLTDDAATKNFSGVASYEKKVAVTPDMLAPGSQLTMTFGDGTPIARTGGGRGGSGMLAYMDSPIHEAAVVTINGKKIGSVWAPPYTLDVTGALTAGENDIQVDVGNLAINYMAGHGFPNYNLTAIRAAFGNRFDPQNVANLQPITAGMLGPVQIVAK